MKKKVRAQQSVPFYSNEPAVSKKLITDQSMSQSASLGNKTPKMVDKNPGRLSGIANFASKSKPSAKPAGIKPLNISAKASSPMQPKLRVSGHSGAHMLGKKI